MDNFYNTAIRIQKDVDILSSSNQSYFNTCYLAGYILECYGKLLILAHDSTVCVKDYGHDLNKINKKIVNDISVNGTYAKYCLDLKTECKAIAIGQSKWSPIKRYEDTSSIWNQKTTADNYINESKKIINVIETMKIDGVI